MKWDSLICVPTWSRERTEDFVTGFVAGLLAAETQIFSHRSLPTAVFHVPWQLPLAALGLLLAALGLLLAALGPMLAPRSIFSFFPDWAHFLVACHVPSDSTAEALTSFPATLQFIAAEYWHDSGSELRFMAGIE